MTGKDLLPLIKAKGRGDRFSENLYKWVKKYDNRDLSVFFMHRSWLDGSNVDYDPEFTQAPQLVVGEMYEDGWVHGMRLLQILGNGTSVGMYAIPPGWNAVLLPDWWENYIKGGKCHIDPEHRLYAGSERWQTNGKTRTCLWCGQWHEQQHKRRVSKTVTSWVKMEDK